MDNETSGLADWFLVRHTIDPELRSQLLSNRESSTSHLPTGRLTENAELDVDTALPTNTPGGSSMTRNFHTNLMEATDNSRPALEPRASDSNTTRRIHSQPCSVNGSDAQLDFTAENLAALCMSDYIVESLEPSNNSRLAIEQAVARAKALMHRAMEERAGRE